MRKILIGIAIMLILVTFIAMSATKKTANDVKDGDRWEYKIAPGNELELVFNCEDPNVEYMLFVKRSAKDQGEEAIRVSGDELLPGMDTSFCVKKSLSIVIGNPAKGSEANLIINLVKR